MRAVLLVLLGFGVLPFLGLAVGPAAPEDLFAPGGKELKAPAPIGLSTSRSASPVEAVPQLAGNTVKSKPKIGTPGYVDEEEAQHPLNLGASPKKSSPAGMSHVDKSMLNVLLLCFAGGCIFLIWWWTKHLKNRLKSHGVSVTILGQTHLDANTKIIIIRVASKILVVAKSSHFCTTLDVISDRNEMNLLTLGAGVEKTDEEFRKVLRDMEKETNRGDEAADAPAAKPIVPEAELRREIDELKRRLGKLK